MEFVEFVELWNFFRNFANMKLLDAIIPARRKRYKIARNHAAKHDMVKEFLMAYYYWGDIDAALDEWDLLDDEYYKTLVANGFQVP